jgi:hypothetical protein
MVHEFNPKYTLEEIRRTLPGTTDLEKQYNCCFVCRLAAQRINDGDYDTETDSEEESDAEIYISDTESN